MPATVREAIVLGGLGQRVKWVKFGSASGSSLGSHQWLSFVFRVRFKFGFGSTSQPQSNLVNPGSSLFNSVRVRVKAVNFSQLCSASVKFSQRRSTGQCKARLHFQNYGTVGIGEPMRFRVLSRRSIFRSLSLFASAVQ
ncbi:hypothetical protein Hdeb2414_s0010g00349711 [Helianthus debilis subsp. tardiflorus]